MNDQTPKPKSFLRWLGVLFCVGVFFTLVMQWRMICHLRNTNASLRLENESRAGNAATSAAVSGDSGQSHKDLSELLRLRNEVRVLREQVGLLKSGGPQSMSQPSTPLSNVPSSGDSISLLASAAVAGDLTALKKLAELSAVAHAQFQTNQDGVVFAQVRSAFDAIGAEAGKGNELALQALLKASRMDDLEGFAVDALGRAAGQGNERALEPLLDPERYFVSLSGAVGALKPAADVGNVRAIQALAKVGGDANSQSLWLLTAQALQGAAKAGNATAIDTLAGLVKSEDQNVRRTAFTALEAAAIDQQRASDALRRLHGQ